MGKLKKKKKPILTSLLGNKLFTSKRNRLRGGKYLKRFQQANAIDQMHSANVRSARAKIKAFNVIDGLRDVTSRGNSSENSAESVVGKLDKPHVA